MASRLLNVLNEIEQGRQECVDILQHKGLDITNDASFEQIADAAELLYTYHNDSIVEIPNDPDRAIVGNTPETDPDLFRIPSYWPDLSNIAVDAPTITYNDVVYLLEYIILLEDYDKETTIFTKRIGDGTAANTPCADNEIAFEVDGNAHTQSYKKSFVLKTSDGAQYVTSQSGVNSEIEQFTHTWDQTQDIVINNKHYKYIIVYRKDFAYGNSSAVLDYTSASPVCLWWFVNNKGPNITINANDSLEYLKIDRTPSEYTTNTSFNCALYHNSSNATETAYYSRFFINRIDCSENITNFSYNQNVAESFLNTLIVPSMAINITSYFNTDYEGVRSLLYLQAKEFTVNSGAYSLHTRSNRASRRLRYLVGESKVTRLGVMVGFENLLIEPITRTVTEIDVGSSTSYTSILDFSFMRRGYLELPELITCNNANVFNHVHVQILELPKWDALPDLHANMLIKELTLGITTMSNSYTGVPVCIEKINFPKLTSYTNTSYSIIRSGSSSGNTYGSPRYLSVPALETMPYASGLNIDTLQWLDVKNNFKFNLNINRTQLCRESILDIFNKAAQLEAGETYTLTLSSRLLDLLTPEEIAIITNKGWTVQ